MASYKIVIIDGLRQSARRGVALLACDDDEDINAATVFLAMLADSSKVNRVRELRTRFDHWIEGVQAHDRWFHGFRSHPGYEDCFVFKWRDKKICQRLYGFLCHPLPIANQRFQLCVLTNHAKKAQWETDISELNKANTLRVDPRVWAAIKMEYPDHVPGAQVWTKH